MKRLLLLVLILVLAACSTTEPEPAAEMADELAVSHVRANMTMPSDTGSLWMEIHNGTDSDDALIGAEFDGCAAIELHDMKMENDVMVMREVEGGKIPIPAGETVELKKGGLHVMCIGKEAPLEVGSNLEVALQFENAGTVNVTAEVVEPGEMPMDMEGDHGNMEMESQE
jgi:copper(I)-binding protein